MASHELRIALAVGFGPSIRDRMKDRKQELAAVVSIHGPLSGRILHPQAQFGGINFVNNS